jgi:cytochrome b
LGALMIYNILLTMAGLVATGYALTTVTFFGVPWVADLHETLVTWAEISALLHVVAVVVESRRLGVNLPKSMVTGTKRLP